MMRNQVITPEAIGTIGVSIADGIATVVIDNPRRRNALNQQMCIDLAEAMEALDCHPEVIAVALRGAGADFSAGAALNDLGDVLFAAGEEGATIDYLSRAEAAIRAVQKPTVALVRGVCMGGGWQIAAGCDILLAADDVRIAITPAKLGIIYPRSGLERLVERVGPDRARYLLFSAREISPQRAESWGLVTEVLPDDEFESAAADLLRTMAQRSQFSITTMKKFINQAPGQMRDQAWENAWREFPEHEDLARGRAAFLKGEIPKFEWRVDAGEQGPPVSY